MIILWIVLGSIVWLSLGCLSNWLFVRKLKRRFPEVPPFKWHEGILMISLFFGPVSLVALGICLLINSDLRKA